MRKSTSCNRQSQQPVSLMEWARLISLELDFRILACAWPSENTTSIEESQNIDLLAYRPRDSSSWLLWICFEPFPNGGVKKPTISDAQSWILGRLLPHEPRQGLCIVDPDTLEIEFSEIS